MNEHFLKTLGLVVAGGVTGSVLGFLFGELAAEKVYREKMGEEAGQWEAMEETAEVEKNDPEAPASPKHPHDYRRYSMDKGELEALASKYKPSDGASIQPVVITEPEWHGAADSGYNKCAINFWDEDQVYSFEDTEDVVENIVERLGANPHLHFGESDESDPDVLYILNEKERVVYDVTRLHSSYAVTVKGEKPKAVKRTGGKAKKVTNDDETKEGDD